MSMIIIEIESTLWINVFEVMLSAYFALIYEEMKSMKEYSHRRVERKLIESTLNQKGGDKDDKKE